jgi:hypothetical protein
MEADIIFQVYIDTIVEERRRDMKCEVCEGSGLARGLSGEGIIDEPCPRCDGEGVRRMTKEEVRKIQENTAQMMRDHHLLRLVSTEPEHEGYTFAQLNGAFDTVKNKNDWKEPIDVVVGVELVGLVAASIEYFTATECKLTDLGDKNYRVESIGYRRGPAGDH